MSVTRTRSRFAVAALALSALLAGCSTLGDGGPRRARPDPVDLADRVRALEARMAAQEEELGRLRGMLRPAGGTGAPAPAAAPAQPVDAPSPPPIEDTPWTPPAAVESSDLDDLAPPGSGERATAADGTSPGQSAGQSDYEAAAVLYREGRFAEAEAAFARFLSAHRDGDLADNALFWIGASRLARGEVGGAEEAFRSVVELYPEGNKVPDALLKLATCREMAGDPAGATAALDAVLERFPGSEAAVQAARRLPASVPEP